ncbi:MAG: hypothetical protein KDN05_06365 [Verrucomicrobiae bacterium]|nr:hypothetical protein [Verrucomicrobiae bacterium]MCP5532278.1 hypothetical protein [Akkermansiaceae bacterium]
MGRFFTRGFFFSGLFGLGFIGAALLFGFTAGDGLLRAAARFTRMGGVAQCVHEQASRNQAFEAPPERFRTLVRERADPKIHPEFQKRRLGVDFDFVVWCCHSTPRESDEFAQKRRFRVSEAASRVPNQKIPSEIMFI